MDGMNLPPNTPPEARGVAALLVFRGLTRRPPEFMRPCRHCGHRELSHPVTPLAARVYGTCASCRPGTCPGYARKRWYHPTPAGAL